MNFRAARRPGRTQTIACALFVFHVRAILIFIMSEYLPEKSETALPWKPDAEFLRVAGELRGLREDEKRGGAIGKRTEAVLALFESSSEGKSFVEHYKKDQGAPFVLYPDATVGLRLDLGLDTTQGVHSHVPYEFITDEALDNIAVVMEDGPLADLRVRVLENRAMRGVAGAENERKALAMHQEQRFLRAAQKPDVATFVEGFTGQYARFSNENPYIAGERLPTSAYADFLTKDTENEGARVMSIAVLASRLNEGTEDEHDPLVGQYRASAAHTFRNQGMSRFTRVAYENRAATLHENPMNAEMSKALSALFTRYDYDALRAVGVETVRGSYADGREFVAFYTTEQYVRVLVDPKKHIRGEAEKKYKTLPAIGNADFEALEGFFVPYFHLKEVLRDSHDLTQEDAPSVGYQINATLSLLSADLSPEDIEALVVPGRKYADALEKRQLDPDAQKLFHERGTAILARYGNRIASPAFETLEQYMKVPERTSARFNELFEDGAPNAEMRENIERFRKTLPDQAQDPEITVIRPSTKKTHIPFVYQGKAIRALKIERRPLADIITGTKFENVDGQAAIDRLADAIVSALETTGANGVPPGTMSGRIAESIVRRHWQERVKGDARSRLFTVVPGKSTYAGPLGYGNDELEKHDPHPLLPIDAILTPYVAGWSPGGAEHTYAHQVYLHRSILRQVSADQPRVTVLVNGGVWSIVECIEAIRDGFPLIVVPESGRLALFVAHLHQTRSLWARAPHSERVDAGLTVLEELIASSPEIERDRLTADLLSMKKGGLTDLIQLIASGVHITESSVDELQGTMERFLSKRM